MNKRNRKNRHYTKEFKDRAVELVLRGESSLTQVAEDMGISAGNLHRWKKEYLSRLDETTSCPKGEGRSPSELVDENEKLRKQLRYMEEQRDILKKALSFFSHPNPPGMDS